MPNTRFEIWTKEHHILTGLDVSAALACIRRHRYEVSFIKVRHFYDRHFKERVVQFLVGEEFRRAAR